MAIITVSGKQIEIITNQIKFMDEETGLVRVVKPQNINLDLISDLVSFTLLTKLITSTGYEIGQPIISTYELEIKATSILGDGFQKPFANAIFRDALISYGIKAKQIFDKDGKLKIIE